MTADGTKAQKLSTGHRKTFGLEDEKKHNKINQSYLDRHALLKDVPIEKIRSAWMTLAHLLVEPGAKVIDMGCGDGTVTYAMAALHPELSFIGVDYDKKQITKAKKSWELPNLTFIAEDARTGSGFAPGSADALINSFVLHKIYTASRYDERAVVDALAAQFSLLKTGGQMLIRDFAVPSGHEYVQIEMPAASGGGNDVKTMAEPELLAWYAEHARPIENQSCQGFFLEELPERFPQTRLFRLPSKWAYEFIARKDDREHIVENLANEYVFFTPQEFRKNLRKLGARVLYSAPQWNESEMQMRFDGRFRLYSDDGTLLGPPPTGYIAVAQKMAERQSLQVHERRQASKTSGRLKVRAMRNEVSGKIVDVVSRDMDLTEILPYRVTETGTLNIFLHDGVPRAIANAVPRGGKEIDGKRWSGHMVEALSVPTDTILDIDKDSVKDTVLFARDWLGLKPAPGALLENGPSCFPAPDFIDEHIKTRYLRVSETKPPEEPKCTPEDITGFTTRGRVREINAQSVLDAISVGYIPNARLEVQILALFDMLGIKAEGWDDCPLILETAEPEELLDTKKFAAAVMDGDKRFKDVKGTSGQLRTIQSVFIDEGQVDGALSGMAAHDMEFIVWDENTVNKAVVLPLTMDLNGKVMAGLCTEHMPIPQRYKGTGLTVSAPCWPLPREITTIEQAKAFIADKFGVTPDKVSRLGESYFCHIGITPQRIFPFAVASAKKVESPIGGPVQFAPMDHIWSIISAVLDWDVNVNLVSSMRKVHRRMGYDSDINLKWSLGRKNLYEAKAPDIGSYSDMSGTKPPTLESS